MRRAPLAGAIAAVFLTAGVSARTQPEAQDLGLAFAAHNATDANHAEFGGTPEGVGIRRSVDARVTWRP